MLVKPVQGDALGDRMKGYERAARTTLAWRIPLIIRIDGKAFHTWTKGCARPFDENLIAAMDQTAIACCEEIEGAAFAFTQSDEISILVHNYKKLQTQPWFGNQVQKIVSVAASVASATMTLESGRVHDDRRPAYFDARAFLVPESDVCNYFLWRQRDATKNSVLMVARSLYTHGELDNKNNSELQEMIHAKGKNWNDLPTRLRRGRCVQRVAFEKDGAARYRWEVDNEIPLFSKDTNYVDRHLAVEPEE